MRRFPVIACVVLVGVSLLTGFACDNSSNAKYPRMPDLKSYSDAQTRYERMVRWGKESCDNDLSLNQMFVDFFWGRDKHSIPKYEVAAALQGWVKEKGYDDPAAGGFGDLSGAVYQGCLKAEKLWGG